MILCNNQNVCTSWTTQQSTIHLPRGADHRRGIPIWYMSIQQSTRMDDTLMIQQTNGTIWTMYRDKSESEKSNFTTINGRSISIGIFPIWYMSYNNQPGWMIREWYNKQMARYEQCIGMNLNRQNRNYTTINVVDKVIFLLEMRNNNIQFDSMCIWEMNDDVFAVVGSVDCIYQLNWELIEM